MSDGHTTGPVIVLVHGAWHGGWCWTRWRDRFEAAGWRVRAIDLPGHGKPGDRRRRWETLGSYVDAVVAEIDRHEGEVVLVGHSMGGLVVQRCLEARSVQRAVLLASVPRRGVLATTLRQLRAHPATSLRSIATLTMWPSVAGPGRVREMFFTDATSTETVAWTADRLQNESYLAYLSMAFRWARPSRVSSPVTVVAAERDGVFTVEEQRGLASAYGTDLVTLPGIGHDAMLDDGAAAAADVVLDLIAQ